MPPTLPTSLGINGLLIPLEPLTPSTFSPFGTAITGPLPDPRKMNKPPVSPSEIPPPLYAPHQPQATLANQNSALKTSPISVFQNSYPSSSANGTSQDVRKPSSWPQMSMFSCFPRNLSGIGMDVPDGQGRVGSASRDVFRVSILERHPYTTQTFLPLGLAAETDSGDVDADGGSHDDDGNDTVFLVIVAPTLPSPPPAATPPSSLSPSSPPDPLVIPQSSSTTTNNPPDLSRIRAFVARGDQAVTYGAGTWHAPMVVLGSRRVDFVVTQFVNGVPDDDCQEVLLGDNLVKVDVTSLLRKQSSSSTQKDSTADENHGLWSMGRPSRPKRRLQVKPKL
ncbi:hypothetical protein B0A52_09210 [Exophiala mesophila]|uniref:Ureidoglycolate hydrolase n=1 Tax=Exophiala mesophila TaxID=212818 RepID=A0A438MTH2_EXOME|nr:hypothetical protein B0A52_09210 [Exophiala mesophila]